MLKLRRTTVATLTAAIACAAPVSAQRQTRPGERARHRRAARSTVPASPVALIRSSTPDYLSGEANVTVRGNQNPIIKLGMAQNGVTIIEFPASDRFFAVHPGNSDLVTIDCRKKEKDGDCTLIPTDHFLVIRAGSGFVVPPAKVKTASQQPTPATSVIVQMQSGIVLPFMIYPVAQLSQQAHRIVVSYDRKEVVAARQAAGLAINLGEAEPPKQQPAEVAAASPSPTSSPKPTPTPQVKPDPEPVVVEVERKSKRVQGSLTEPTVIARNALAAAIREPKQFKRWSAPMHGLAVSTLSRDINEKMRLVVVAVRNTNAEAIRVVPGHPEMFIETLSDKGTRLQVEQIKRLQTETTTTNSVIPAGATVYYALIYETPILGAKQRLQVAVGQTNAADEPAATNLAAATR